jgi:phage shock protein A
MFTKKETLMLKTVLTLLRGLGARANETLADSNALLMLDQQIREAGVALDRSKRALALAIAQDGREGKRLETIHSRIGDLEVRVKEALRANHEQLSREGAEAIAALEADRDAALTARVLFASEISRLGETITQAEQRLIMLDRGRRVARATEAVRTLKKNPIQAKLGYESKLSEAENTLRRLRERQAEALAADDAIALLNQAESPLDTAEKLAAQGFGPRLKTTAKDVLIRLAASESSNMNVSANREPRQ